MRGPRGRSTAPPAGTFSNPAAHGGIPVGVIAIEGASCERRRPAHEAAPGRPGADYSVPSPSRLLINTPNPPQLSGKIADSRKALLAAMPKGGDAKMVGFAQSLGAVFLQDYVFKHADDFSAQFLTGASLGRKYRNGSVSTGYPVPTMAIDGTLDGLYRLTRQAEGYYMKDPKLSRRDLRGRHAHAVASGAPPSNVAKNDLKPEVTYDAARYDRDRHGRLLARAARRRWC